MMIWGVIEDVDLIGIGAIVFFIGVAQLLFIFLGKKYFVNNADSINNSQNKENEISE